MHMGGHSYELSLKCLKRKKERKAVDEDVQKREASCTVGENVN